MIVGIDEVGRGPWAGPLVVGAVVLGDDAKIEGLTDSKALSKRKRELLSNEIIQKAAAFGLGWVDSAEIDKNGLSESLRLATRRALEQIDVPYHEIIIDGTINFLSGTGKGPYVTTLKKADLLISSVSAASIIAKVARDDYMEAIGEEYPGYGFERHVGYGTAAHKAAIVKHGITPLHRRSFAPIAALAGEKNLAAKSIVGTNKDTGNKAESVATEWLEGNGYTVVERNWKTRFCEIDVVARRDSTYYFVEVKHRKSAKHGDGLEAITPRKLRQMQFAAQVYRKANRLLQNDAVLMVVTTTGSPPMFESELLLS